MKKKSCASRKGMASLGPLLTVAQVGQRLGRARTTVRKLITRKRLAAVLVGSDILVTERSVDDYLRPRPYVPRRGTPVCAGWNDKLKADLAQAQESGAES